MADDWLDRLKRLVQKKPLVLFRFEGEEWSRLCESRRGANEFTIARSHDLFEKVRVPTACLVIGKDDDGSEVYFGLASSRSTVTTLESRIKVKRALHIQPSSKAGILKLVTDKAHARNLRDRLSSRESVIALSPKLSVHLVEKLAAIESNRGAMRAAVVLLSAPKYYRGMDAVQEDAVHTALRAFGLSPGDQVVSLELTRGRYTALVRVNIMEDSVVEYDARTFPDYELIGSDITGRAVSIRARRRRCSWSVRMARTNSSTTGCGATTTSSIACSPPLSFAPWPGALRSTSPSGPCALKRKTQSRITCRPTAPIRAASVRRPPS